MIVVRNLINKGKSLDWTFLCFLIGITNVRLPVKFVALVFYCVVMLIRKVRVSGTCQWPVLFYVLMPMAGLIGALFTNAFQMKGYWLGTAFSAGGWFMSAMVFVLIWLTLKTRSKEQVKETVEGFFVLNALMALWQLISMVIASKHFPYWYQDPMGVYGISSGDHLYGLFINNTSVTNAAISMIGVFYFLFQKRTGYALLCLVVCVLCVSNLILLFLLAALVFILLFYRHYRKTAFLFLLYTLGVYFIVTPSNLEYSQRLLSKFASDEKQRIEIITSQPELAPTGGSVINKTNAAAKKNSTYRPSFDDRQAAMLADFVRLREISAENRLEHPSEPYQPDTLKAMMARWYGVPYEATGLGTMRKFGKFYSFRQTRYYLRERWSRMLFGAGAGNFSSRMAWRATGLNEQGGYPAKYRYVSDEYLYNHFYTHMFFMALPISEHSIINSPNSVYNQLLGEYGCVGALLFLVLYIGYFIKLALKDRRKIIFILALLFLFCFEYWFEMLTLTVFFELFMLSDFKPDPTKKIGNA